MGGNSRCSWRDGKRDGNLANHGYDFADIEEVFDGRFCVTRLDTRKNDGGARYNVLVDFKGRVLNITFNPRVGLIHQRRRCKISAPTPRAAPPVEVTPH